ncbi:deoxyribodipyrimidine photo-lyase [Chloroflexota bacterium]
MIQEERIKYLNRKSPQKADFVLYWMQASQRTEYNHALEFAINQANQLKLPLIVYFGLTDKFPEANERHYHFMLEGLKWVQGSLRNRGIGMVIQRVSPEIGAVKLAKKASLLICDRGYLNIQKKWRGHVSENIECQLIQVETDVVVPVEISSNKEEYSAATLRSKIKPILNNYLVSMGEQTAEIDSTKLDFESYDISDTSKAVAGLVIDRNVKSSPLYNGGTEEARRHLNEFINKKMANYDKSRNDPNENCLSNLSPYLHFGQISPLYVALEISRQNTKNSDAFLEELIVRRELSMNFVHHNPYYDSYKGLPKWVKQTLAEHQKDARRYLYSREVLEQANTHDPYWNAAQREMIATGKMHGYMRMYWGKKILEWTSDHEEAYATALYLNNKYELDGRDPNGFTGVAWCFGKHDRPWARRAIFGNVRYMSAEGLKRKFDVEIYARKYNSDDP